MNNSIHLTPSKSNTNFLSPKSPSSQQLKSKFAKLHTQYTHQRLEQNRRMTMAALQQGSPKTRRINTTKKQFHKNDRRLLTAPPNFATLHQREQQRLELYKKRKKKSPTKQIPFHLSSTNKRSTTKVKTQKVITPNKSSTRKTNSIEQVEFEEDPNSLNEILNGTGFDNYSHPPMRPYSCMHLPVKV